MQDKLISDIVSLLKKNASPETKKTYEKYFKGVVKYHGLKGCELKPLFKQIHQDTKHMDIEQIKSLCEKLRESEYSEQKRIATNLMEKHYKKLQPVYIDRLQRIIEKYIYDWGNCDIFSSKVVGNMIILYPQTGYKVQQRKNSRYMRVQRSACVSFLKVARFGKHNDIILDICSETIKNDERFVQLGTGWILRELSLADLNLVVEFIKDNYKHFSREGLRYAIEKMQPELRKELMDYGKI